VTEAIRAAVTTDPGVITASIGQEADGLVIVRVHETAFSADGHTVEPTGRVVKVPVPRDLPADPHQPGQSVYPVTHPKAARWPAYMEEGLTRFGESQPAPDIDSWQLPGHSDADAGPPPGHRQRLVAETLTQITGRPARIIDPLSSGEVAAAIWKRLINEGRPVLIQAKPEWEQPSKAFNIDSGKTYRIDKIGERLVTLHSLDPTDSATKLVPLSQLEDRFYLGAVTLGGQDPLPAAAHISGPTDHDVLALHLRTLSDAAKAAADDPAASHIPAGRHRAR
jgi:hypothetical protein